MLTQLKRRFLNSAIKIVHIAP